ncbi:MAG TPA: hypothetical protein DCO65_10300 [Spartobacteria bacterium]|jgi:hypothetical protein|nr:hypothetical protein [Spartobacteria bacterium]
MTTCSLVVLADRGGLKVYRVNEMPTRAANLHLIHDFQITGSERELPFNVESSRHHVTLTSDWPALETETNRRICKHLAERIATIVNSECVEGWSFAAEPSIHKAIVDLLPVEIRERIVEHVPSDLVKIEPAKLRSHFRSLTPLRSAESAKVAARVKRPPRRGLVLRNSEKR